MKIKKPKIIDFKWQVLLINIIASIVIITAILFIGLSVNFIFINLMPGDPVLAYLPAGPYDPAAYAYWNHVLGFDRPIIVQYFKYLGDLFTGNWGKSVSINRGQDVGSLILQRLPRTIDLLLLPTILGLLIGIILGRIAFKFRNSWIDKIIQVFIVIGISIPVFIGGIVLQRFLAYDLGMFPATGYKDMGLGDPKFVTGFRIIDALISGQLYIVTDYLYHLVLPVFCLSIATIVLITLMTRCSRERKLYEKSILSNTLITGLTFSLIFTFCILIEITFGFKGIGKLTIDAIRESDYFVLRTLIFIIIIFLVVVIVVSNIIFSILKSLTFSRDNPVENNPTSINTNNTDQAEKKANAEPKKDLRKHLRLISRYLFIVIASIILVYIIIVASFPQLISGYSFEEAEGIYSNAWQPPSEEHILGTRNFGRDVFARLLYGAQDALIFGFGAVFIGLIGGVPLGLFSSIHRYIKKVFEAFLIILFIIPTLLLIAIVVTISGQVYFILISTIGSLLIPIFALITANYPINKRNIINSLKKTAIHIPLMIAFTILIYESLGFLGFNSPGLIVWGNDLTEGRIYLQTAPWASLWLGFYIFITLIGFFLLYFGLKNFFADSLASARLSENEL